MKKIFIYLIPVLFIFNLFTNTTTVDAQVVGVDIYDLTETVNSDSATIEWTTGDFDVTTTFEYYYGSVDNTVYATTTSDSVPSITHQVQLSDLFCDTDYYYTIYTFDEGFEEPGLSATGYFTTDPCETTIENVVEEVATSTVTISWDTITILTTGVNDLIHSTSSHPIVDPIPTDLSFEIFNADMNTHRASHQAQLTGLTCNTTYYYSILLYDHGVSVDDPALTYDDSFTTSSCEGTVVNMSVVSDKTSIIFSFDIDELPPFQTVQYGTTDSYGGSSDYVSNPTPNSIKISNLSCGTQYYYSITASGAYDENGEILIAEEDVFSTENCSSGGGGGGGGGGSSSRNKDANTDDQNESDDYNDEDVVIEKEDADAIVRIVQMFLNILGFDVALTGPGSYGYETFFFGKLTEAAIKKYQEFRGISITGNIDVLTVRTLVNDMFPFVGTVDDKKWNEKLVLAKAGDSGFLPRLVQVFLNTLGYNVAPSGPGSTAEETEYFGTLTEKALRSYQISNGLDETGKIDVITLRYMISDIFPFIENKSAESFDEYLEEYLYEFTEEHEYLSECEGVCDEEIKCSYEDVEAGSVSNLELKPLDNIPAGVQKRLDQIRKSLNNEHEVGLIIVEYEDGSIVDIKPRLVPKDGSCTTYELVFDDSSAKKLTEALDNAKKKIVRLSFVHTHPWKTGERALKNVKKDYPKEEITYDPKTDLAPPSISDADLDFKLKLALDNIGIYYGAEVRNYVIENNGIWVFKVDSETFKEKMAKTKPKDLLKIDSVRFFGKTYEERIKNHNDYIKKLEDFGFELKFIPTK